MNATRGRSTAVAVVLALAVPMIAVPMAGVPAVAQAPTRRLSAPVNLAVGVAQAVQARVLSNRVFKNVDEQQAQVTSTYAAYVATAEKNLAAAQQAKDTVAVQRDTRVLAVLKTEQATQTEILAGMRQNAYDVFRKPEFRNLVSTIANVGPVNRIFNQASAELADLSSKVGGLRARLASGTPLSLTELDAYSTQLNRWRGVWSMIAGPKGEALTTVADKASAALRRVTKNVTSVDADLADTESGLQALADGFKNVQQVKVRPRGGGFFGFITNLLGIDTRVIDALRNLIRPRVSNIPGYSAAQIDKVLGDAMLELMRRRFADCRDRSGYDLRNLADNPDLGLSDTSLPQALGAVADRLPLCGEPTGQQLLAIGEAMAEPVATGSPATRPVGGGVYSLDTLNESDPGATAAFVRLEAGSLSVRDTSVVPLMALRGDAVGAPELQLTVDFETGTASGSFSATYECTAELCMGATGTGYAKATFENVPLQQAPTSPPADFPFPAHHWYDLEKDWWYGLVAVDVEVSLVGTSFDGREGGYTTSVRGWVQVALSPMGSIMGARPYGWRATTSVRLDYPDTVNPQWDLYIGADADIWEARVPVPPTTK